MPGWGWEQPLSTPGVVHASGTRSRAVSLCFPFELRICSEVAQLKPPLPTGLLPGHEARAPCSSSHCPASWREWPGPTLPCAGGWGVAGLSVGPGAAPSSTRAPSLPPEGRLLQSACFFLGACYFSPKEGDFLQPRKGQPGPAGRHALGSGAGAGLWPVSGYVFPPGPRALPGGSTVVPRERVAPAARTCQHF